MALRNTTVKPSTCDCVFVYQYDDEYPAEFRLHEYVAVSPCAEDHPKPAIGETYEKSPFAEHHFDTKHGKGKWKDHIKDIGHLKDESLRTFAKEVAALIREITFIKPSELKDNGIEFEYGQNRVLRVSCPELQQEKKASLQTQADRRFGAGKVLFL